MSRRKDRERVQSMKRLDPDYKGFRGYGSEPNRPGKTPLETVKCRVCGRKRNVPRGIAVEQGESYVCLACRAAEPAEPQLHEEQPPTHPSSSSSQVPSGPSS